LSFTVDKTGRIVDLLTAGSIGLAYDRAAVKALSQLPRFEPGRLDGQPVPVRIEQSIGFPARTPATVAAIKAARAARAAQKQQPIRAVAIKMDGSQKAKSATVAARPAPATAETSRKVYPYVEQMPTLPSGAGNAALEEAIKQRLQLSPAEAEACKGGRIQVKFIVEPNGAVSEPHIERGLAQACNEAVLAAVKRLPTFNPGMQNGEKVPVYLTAFVSF
jgi:hypothetical protein